MTTANYRIADLYDCTTIHMISGSQEYLKPRLWRSDINGNTTGPVDLSSVSEIEWRFAPFSVIPEKNTAVLRKRYSTGEIIILRDSAGNLTNQIQVTIAATDTAHLKGAFLHQILVTDGAGSTFIPFEGVINLNRQIALY